jgi:hypothetical protein
MLPFRVRSSLANAEENYGWLNLCYERKPRMYG